MSFGLAINWVAWFFYLFVICVTALVFMHGPREWRRLRKWIASRTPNYSTAADEVLSHICYFSLIGTAWPDEMKKKQGMQTLLFAGESGKIGIQGVPTGGTEHKVIERSEMRGARLKTYNTTDRREALALLTEDGKKVLYTGLIVDTNKVLRLWPKKDRTIF